METEMAWPTNTQNFSYVKRVVSTVQCLPVVSNTMKTLLRVYISMLHVLITINNMYLFIRNKKSHLKLYDIKMHTLKCDNYFCAFHTHT